MCKQNKKEIIIFSNYNVDEKRFEDAKQRLIELADEDGYEPSDEEVWEEARFLEEENWEYVRFRLQDFFRNSEVLVKGTVGRWNGTFEGGIVAPSFMSGFESIMKDCDYWEFKDVNGHLMLTCSHHDGTNHVEFYKLTEKGAENFHNWEYDSYGPWARFSEKEVHELMIRNHYARLPHFADAEFGKEVA